MESSRPRPTTKHEGAAPRMSGKGLALRILLVALPGLLLLAGVAAWTGGLLPPSWGLGPHDRASALPAERAHSLLVREQRESTARLRLAARLLATEPALADLPPTAASPPPATPAAEADAAGTGASPAAETSAVPAAAWTDLLEQRSGELGYDFALVLAPDGRVLAATEELSGLAGRPLPGAAGLLAAARDGGDAGGAWRLDDRLAWIAAARVAPEFELRGHVAAGRWLGELAAVELRAMADAAVLLAVPSEGGGWRASAASAGGELADALLAALPEDPGSLTPGEPVDRGVDLAGGTRRAVILPLGMPGGELAGAAVLAPEPAADSRTRLLVLAAALGAALLLTLLLAAVVARAVTAPVGRLAGHVAAAPQEGFARRLEPRRHGLLAPLAAALDRLFAALREERSLAAVAAGAAAGAAGWAGAGSGTAVPGAAAPGGTAGSAAAPAEPGEAPGGEPETRRAALVAVDLRSHARPSPAGPRATAERLARDAARVRSEVAARGGHLCAAAGHRLLAEFGEDGDVSAETSPAGKQDLAPSGPEGSRLASSAEARAVAAAAAVLAALAADAAGGDGEPPAVAVASGSVTTGPAGLLPGSPAVAGFLVGPAVQIADSLLREAAPGDLVMTRAVHRAVEPLLEVAGVAASAQRGLLSPQPLYLLGEEGARRLAAQAPAPPQEPRPAPSPAEAAGLPTSAPSPSGAAPETVAGRYEVVAAAAEPGGSERARDRDTGDEVALRRLPGLAGETAGFDGPLPALRRVAHPNLARTLDFGEGLGGGYLVRAWVRGAPLPALGEVPVPAALAIARQVAAGLAALHADGLAHLRLKPENVLVEPSGRVVVTDAGVGLVEGPAPSASAGERLLAPEQRDGGRGDARSDVWTAGALLGRLATGAWWSERDHEAGLPAGLAAVVERCLAEDPERRYPDAAALEEALRPVVA